MAFLDVLQRKMIIIGLRAVGAAFFIYASIYGLLLAIRGFRAITRMIQTGEGTDLLESTVFLAIMFLVGAVFCGIVSFHLVGHVIGDLKSRRDLTLN